MTTNPTPQPPPPSLAAQLREVGEAFEALAKRHDWMPGYGKCICPQHNAARESLSLLPALLDAVAAMEAARDAGAVARQPDDCREAFRHWHDRFDWAAKGTSEALREAFQAGRNTAIVRKSGAVDEVQIRLLLAETLKEIVLGNTQPNAIVTRLRPYLRTVGENSPTRVSAEVELVVGTSATETAKAIIESIWAIWYGKHRGKMDSDEMAGVLEGAKQAITQALVNAQGKDEMHCVDCCCARAWKALGISQYTGKSIAEHITELRNSTDRESIGDFSIRDAYRLLLRLDYSSGFRIRNQDIYARLVDEVARAEGRDCQKVQDEYEAESNQWREEATTRTEPQHAQPACEGWQPISTAPRDGGFILAWAEDEHSHPRVVQWKDDAWRKDEYAYREPYWYYSGLTHWMPTPKPPAPQPKEGQ